jgi:hypothetical protein
MNCRRLMCSPQAENCTVPHCQCGCASQQIQVANVRFGSLADIVGYQRDVRFTPENRHWWLLLGCPLVPKADVFVLLKDLIRSGEER